MSPLPPLSSICYLVKPIMDRCFGADVLVLVHHHQYINAQFFTIHPTNSIKGLKKYSLYYGELINIITSDI